MSGWYWALLVFLALLGPTAYAAYIGAPWVPARKKAIERALKELEVDADDVFVDLGCGDGKVLALAAQMGAKVVGYELSPFMWPFAKLRVGRKGKVFFRNFYNQTLPPETTIVYAFLVPDTMPRFKKYLLGQNLTNVRYVISYAFSFKDLQPLHVVREKNCPGVYIYDPAVFRDV